MRVADMLSEPSSAAVMLVEDDTDTREMYAIGLQMAGFQVTTAATAEQAMERLASIEPVVFILDIALPGEDGFELCGRIRRLERYSTTPIIGITAITLVQAMIQARQAGFDEVLTKPCRPNELVEAVKRASGAVAAVLPAPVAAPPSPPVKGRLTPSERGWKIRNRRTKFSC